MTDWLGIEVFSIIGGIMGFGVIVVIILERITLSNNKILQRLRE